MMARNPAKHSKLESGDSITKGFTKVLAGSLVGQMVSFLALPVLSRIYSPTDYGTFTLIMSIAGVIIPVAVLGMDQAVVQPNVDREVRAQVALGFIGLTLVSVLCFAGYWIYLSQNSGQVLVGSFYSFVLAILVWLGGAALILNQLAIKRRNYGALGSRNSVQSLTITISQVLLGAFVVSSAMNGLLLGAILGGIVGVLVLIKPAREFISIESIQDLRCRLKKDWRYPLVFAPSSLLSQFTQIAPLLFVIHWFGIAFGGQVGMAEKLVAVPVALLGFASSSVFSGELSRSARVKDGRAKEIYLRSSLYLIVVGILIALGLIVLSPIVLPSFLGEEWTAASRITQVMALVAGTRILTTPTRWTFRVYGKAKQLLTMELLKLLFITIAGLMVSIFGVGLIFGLAALYGAVAIADLATWFTGFTIAKKHSET